MMIMPLDLDTSNTSLTQWADVCTSTFIQRHIIFQKKLARISRFFFFSSCKFGLKWNQWNDTSPESPEHSSCSEAAGPRASACISSTAHLLNLHRTLESLQQNRDNALRGGLQASNPPPPPSTTLPARYLNCTRQAASNYRRIKRDQHVQFKLRDHAGK